jgi:hypothetical protein
LESEAILREGVESEPDDEIEAFIKEVKLRKKISQNND